MSEQQVNEATASETPVDATPVDATPVDPAPVAPVAQAADNSGDTEAGDSEAGDSDGGNTVVRMLSVGQQVKGTVKRITEFGAFVDIGVGRDGLVHISELSAKRVGKVSDVLQDGQEVMLWIKKLDRDRNRISLTMIEPGTERKPPERGAGGDRRRSNPEAGGDRPPRRDGGRPGNGGRCGDRGHPQRLWQPARALRAAGAGG